MRTGVFSRSLRQVSDDINSLAEARQRHWSRLVRCADHEVGYRADRVRVLTNELDDLFAEKRQLLAGKSL